METGKARTPAEALSLAEEIQKLRLENKEQAKEIKRLTELNEFPEEASAFFTARRQMLNNPNGTPKNTIKQAVIY